jgi:protein-tyrosine phosphatase
MTIALLTRTLEAVATTRRSRWVWLVRVPVLMALLAGAGFALIQYSGNFGVVDPGRVYRSRRPGGDLAEWVRAYRLATILNLSGGTYQDSWYASEVRIAREMDVDFYDIPLSATRRPTRRELKILVDLLERCRYPLLIHCKSGSDRTGMVSALYLLLKLGETPEQALRSFSLEYGHVPIGGPEHLHEPFLEYAEWLKMHELPHTPERFRAWLARDYRADDPARDLPPLRIGPRERSSASAPR